jgi:hypothetical protein
MTTWFCFENKKNIRHWWTFQVSKKLLTVVVCEQFSESGES